MCFCNFVLSKNRNNLLVKVVAMYNWSNFNMTRHFEPKTTREGKREPCRDCGKLFKTSILQSHQRIHTKRSNFQRKVQPSTLVPAQTSFGSWINIGWNPAWGGCAIFPQFFWHSETSYCTVYSVQCTGHILQPTGNSHTPYTQLFNPLAYYLKAPSWKQSGLKQKAET